MSTVFDGIDPALASWLQQQPVFFVATAPLAADGLVNVSPKGMLGTFTVIDEHTAAYLDVTGSGVETIAHLQENGRIVVMMTAFDGRPRVVRLHGRGEPVLLDDPRFEKLAGRFTRHPGERAVIVVHVERVSDSCGYSIPTMQHVADRDVLDLWATHKGPEGLVDYRAEKNSRSLDGLPGVTV